jgi:nucleoside-diphosphate-sugar epimerase
MNNTQKAEAIVQEDVERVLSSRTDQLRNLANGHLFITGGTGFLGAWLLELLTHLNARHDFNTRISIFSRTPERFVAEHLRLGENKAVKLLRGDVCYMAEIPDDVTHIIHAAALTDRNHFASNPIRVGEINAVGTLRVLRAAQLLPELRNFLLISSGLVNGAQPFDLPLMTENHAGGPPPFDANSIYAESKRFAETIAAAYLSETKLPISIARPFGFVGPYQSLALPWAITDFIRDSLSGGPLKIMGDGSTVRSLMYASDFAFWILAITANARPRSIFNVGSPEGIDLLSLASMIAQYFNPVPEIMVGLAKTGHPPTRLVPSVQAAERHLALRPLVGLADAVQRTVNWHKLVHQS